MTLKFPLTLSPLNLFHVNYGSCNLFSFHSFFAVANNLAVTNNTSNISETPLFFTFKVPSESDHLLPLPSYHPCSHAWMVTGVFQWVSLASILIHPASIFSMAPSKITLKHECQNVTPLQLFYSCASWAWRAALSSISITGDEVTILRTKVYWS